MSLQELLNVVTDKGNFQSVKDFIQFCQRYLIFTVKGLQAIIVSQNESNYRFFQYKEDGHYNITRPINFNLMYTAETGAVTDDFLRILRNSSDLPTTDDMSRAVIRNSIYTIQQSIGATLDALPVGKSNVARKINGDLFERFILLLVREAGIDCRSGVIRVPMVVDGMKEFSMSYQHDLLLYQEDELKVIGSVKTSSKDRLDKIFIDKFLYNRLTETTIPHIAIFLNDVQRKKTKQENGYGINSTFLSGHFKGYTVKLNPLEGVYYCDIRPNMVSDEFFKQHIKTIDSLFCGDLREFLSN